MLIDSYRDPGSCRTLRLLPAETVEFSVSCASEESMPFVRREPENRPFGVPAVAYTDLAIGQARDLDAVAVGETQRALNPVRSRTWFFEHRCIHATTSLICCLLSYGARLRSVEYLLLNVVA